MAESAGMKVIIERIAAESQATHLRNRILDDQRRIADHYSGVDGMQYPNNLLGEMQELLAGRAYHEIDEKVQCLHRWIDGAQTVQRMLERTLVLIEEFVIFYRVSQEPTDEQ